MIDAVVLATWITVAALALSRRHEGSRSRLARVAVAVLVGGAAAGVIGLYGSVPAVILAIGLPVAIIGGW
jgi:hypothetical protein